MKNLDMFNHIKACIFDLDGTLVDSLGLWDDIDIRFFHDRGMEVPKGYDIAINHMSFMEMAVYTKETYNLKETPEEIGKIWLDMSADAYKNIIVTKPGAKEFLEHIKSLHIPMALATTNKKELYEPCIRRNNIEEYFSYCMNVNDINSSKKEPKIYLTLSEMMNARPEETLVFEDILMALTTAHNAGFKTAAVYDKRNNSDLESILSISDYYISSFPELMKN